MDGPITGKNSVANKLLLYGEFGYNLRIFPFELFFGRLMVVIRLARGGAKKRPFYQIVAADSRPTVVTVVSLNVWARTIRLPRK